MIVFGFGGSKRTDRGAVWPAVCGNCRNQVLMHHVTTHASFRLFFVPIVPYNRKHFLLCPVCQQGWQLAQQDVARVEAGKLLLVRARMGEITEAQYGSELTMLRNPSAVTIAASAVEGGAVPGTAPEALRNQ